MMPFRLSKLRNVKVQIVIVMTLLVIYVLASYIIVEKYLVKIKTNITAKPKVKLEYVVVHLDLKGAPPRLEYLESILPMLMSHGVNGLLIEYEDMFPYEGSLKTLRAKNCYTKKELQAYLTAAVSSGFEIIPLIQTFGHLEFALKHLEFIHLREVLKHQDSICPSSLESKKFLREMLKQVIRFHQKIAPLNYIHIGCDEVYHLNKCRRCQNRNLTNLQLQSSHLKFVTNTIRALSPLSTVLVWDDMYRAVKPLDCGNLVFPNTEVVYWDYTPNNHDDVHINMYKYGRMFENLWIATAFKGADGASEILPNLKNRFYNHLHWLDFIFDYGTMKNLYNIKGIILTGWSRYAHGNPLCELFPASIPSLILNLILINKYTNGIVAENVRSIDEYISQHIRSSFDSSLQCNNNTKNFLDFFDSRSCDYRESDLHVVLQILNNETSILNSIVDENAHKYYKSENNNTLELEENGETKFEYEYVDAFQSHKDTCSRIFGQLKKIENEIIGLLSEFYDNLVILEFVRWKIRRSEKMIDGLMDFWKFIGLDNDNTSKHRNSSIHIKKHNTSTASNSSVHIENKSRK